MNKNLDRRIHPIAEADGLSPKKLVMAWCAQSVVDVPVQMDKYNAPEPEFGQWSSELEESKQGKLACKPRRNGF